MWYVCEISNNLFLHLFPQDAFCFESEVLYCAVTCYLICVIGFGLNFTEFQILIPQPVLLSLVMQQFTTRA
jgi:hypothetical protein